MKLKFTKEETVPEWWVIEEDFNATDICFPEILGNIFIDELGAHWAIAEEYSGIISTDELEQIIKFMKELQNDAKR